MYAKQLNQEFAVSTITIILVAGVLLLLPQLRLAQGHPVAFLEETYYHYNNLEHPQQLFDVLLQSLFTETNSLFLRILPLALAIASLFLLLLHLTRKQRLSGIAFLTLLIVSFTPAFLAAHLALTFTSVVLFLFLLITYLYRINSGWFLLFLLGLLVLDPLTGSILALALAIYSYTHAKKSSSYLIVLLSTITLSLFFFFLPYRIFIYEYFQLSLNSFFSFFGAIYGFSLFLVVLTIVGYLPLLLRKQLTTSHTLLFLLLVASLFYLPLRLPGIIIAGYYSARALIAIINHRYAIARAGQLILLLLICIFIFSTVSFITTSLHEQPLADQVKVFTLIKQTNLPSQTLLVHPAIAEAATFYSGQQAYGSFQRGTAQQALDLFNTRDYSLLSKTLQESKTAFIVLDNNVYQYLERQNTGIVFLLENNKQFKETYRSPTTKVYYFTAWNQTSS